MNITLTLTEDEANALHDLVGWAGDNIGDILDDANRGFRFKPDAEIIETYAPLFDVSQRVSELIKAETTKETP
jgi:hypothetical protein